MGYVDKALSAHLRSTLHAGFTPMSAKVADLQENDTAKHFLTLADMGLPSNVVAVLLISLRVSGTGFFLVYPNEGTQAIVLTISVNAGSVPAFVGVSNNRIQWSGGVANDDWDIYCMGYFTSGRVVT